jgi:hypothetical protein
VKQGEKLGFGKALAEHLEHLLAAAHAGQPVVDEGNLHVAFTKVYDARASTTGGCPASP